ncbi:MAG TPA: hypothetical protein PKZ12_00075 [Smithellaceae bacterium]|nr:hypothetical protein [Smithellaceae bacterium]
MVELIFDENEDWEKRVLCSDGNCIGTIGADGRCRECGKPYEGALKVGDVEAKADDCQVLSQPKNLTTNNDVSAPDDEWDKRILCSDGCCTGTIGPNGLCRECGKPLQ